MDHEHNRTFSGRMTKTVKTMIGRERKGSETRTWAFAGLIIGTLIGAALAVFEVVWFNLGYLGYQPGATSDQMTFIGHVAAPLVLILFGAFAGTLVGVGTPRHNPHPQQGRGRAYHFFGGWNRTPASSPSSPRRAPQFQK